MKLWRRRKPRQVRYPSVEEVVVYREYMVHRYFKTGDPPLSGGPWNEALLISALNAPAQTYGGEELFPDLADKAACLFRSLIKNHPFLDGNKRTAVITTLVFVVLNRRILLAEQGELADLALEVARSTDAPQILERLRQWFHQRIFPRLRRPKASRSL